MIIPPLQPLPRLQVYLFILTCARVINPFIGDVNEKKAKKKAKKAAQKVHDDAKKGLFVIPLSCTAMNKYAIYSVC